MCGMPDSEFSIICFTILMDVELDEPCEMQGPTMKPGHIVTNSGLKSPSATLSRNYHDFISARVVAFY